MPSRVLVSEAISRRETHKTIRNMNIINYKPVKIIVLSLSIDGAAYEAYVANDLTGTGAVKAGDWISDEEIEEFGIDAAKPQP